MRILAELLSRCRDLQDFYAPLGGCRRFPAVDGTVRRQPAHFLLQFGGKTNSPDGFSVTGKVLEGVGNSFPVAMPAFTATVVVIPKGQ